MGVGELSVRASAPKKKIEKSLLFISPMYTQSRITKNVAPLCNITGSKPSFSASLTEQSSVV